MTRLYSRSDNPFIVAAVNRQNADKLSKELAAIEGMKVGFPVNFVHHYGQKIYFCPKY
jgi:hypothetical protein